MKNYLDSSDDVFELNFINCRINPEDFTHEAHLRLAWINIVKYGAEKGQINILNQLKNFVIHVGAKDKFHKTLTVASFNVINHFIQKSTSHSFTDFIEEFPLLKFDFKKFIYAHYSLELINSELARRKYVYPDLKPFE
ncbi:hypothetical protein [Tenacibaculum sp. 190524A05c]|uniref:Uncharacterized protein n=1 Tax=Tenacibaculum platacis TaxID=3137852 RepID=A0ABP1ELH1_9FLAO